MNWEQVKTPSNTLLPCYIATFNNREYEVSQRGSRPWMLRRRYTTNKPVPRTVPIAQLSEGLAGNISEMLHKAEILIMEEFL